MRITLAQISPKLNRSNLEYIISIINEFKENSDLIVFPELSLNGYMLQDKLFEDAWSIDELEILSILSRHVDIVVGGALRDGDLFRNSALYFSDGQLLSKHDKVHLPNYGMFEEARYFEAGNIFQSFVSKYGKISMLVCEDLWHESVHKDLIKENPDYIIALVASPARGFSNSGLKIEDEWYKIIRTISKECMARVIFVNRVGFEDGVGFWGGSCILEKTSEFLDKLPKYERVIKTFNI